MTKQQAKDFIHDYNRYNHYIVLINAMANGKTIQYRDGEYAEWDDIESPCFNKPYNYYRIKPEPVKVHLTRDDLKDGDVFKYNPWSSLNATDCVYTMKIVDGKRIYISVAGQRDGIVRFNDNVDISILQPDGTWETHKTIQE